MEPAVLNRAARAGLDPLLLSILNHFVRQQTSLAEQRISEIEREEEIRQQEIHEHTRRKDQDKQIEALKQQQQLESEELQKAHRTLLENYRIEFNTLHLDEAKLRQKYDKKLKRCECDLEKLLSKGWDLTSLELAEMHAKRASAEIEHQRGIDSLKDQRRYSEHLLEEALKQLEAQDKECKEKYGNMIDAGSRALKQSGSRSQRAEQKLQSIETLKSKHREDLNALVDKLIDVFNSDCDAVYGGDTHWEGAMQDPERRGGDFKYYCPVGWRRYGICAGDTVKCNGWNVLYHGTASAQSKLILGTCVDSVGLFDGKYGSQEDQVSCFTPCIDYAAHPHHANSFEIRSGRWCQYVLQCRVEPEYVSKRQNASLLEPAVQANVSAADKWRLHMTTISPNYSNSSLEWLVKTPTPETGLSVWRGVTCFGILCTTSEVRPDLLPENRWWKNCSDTTRLFSTDDCSADAQGDMKSRTQKKEDPIALAVSLAEESEVVLKACCASAKVQQKEASVALLQALNEAERGVQKEASTALLQALTEADKDHGLMPAKRSVEYKAGKGRSFARRQPGLPLTGGRGRGKGVSASGFDSSRARPSVRVPHTHGGANGQAEIGAEEQTSHDIVPISQHPAYTNAPQNVLLNCGKVSLSCHVCNEPTSLYCKSCTQLVDDEEGRPNVVAICSFDSKHGSKCLNLHFKHGYLPRSTARKYPTTNTWASTTLIK